MMRLIYCVISSPIVLPGTQRIVCSQNSQMASRLIQICILHVCSTLTILSFPLEIEKIAHKNLYVFSVVANSRSKKSSMAPQL